MKLEREIWIFSFGFFLFLVLALSCIEKKIEFNENESLKIAENFLINSETYKFDGFDLRHLETITMECPHCWTFTFEFFSRHESYGNRTGQTLAQVITKHRAKIIVQEGKITSAILDDIWDELNKKFISEIQNPASVYCEKQGGILKIRKDQDGNEYGVCVFSDGTECEEWAFFRGECKQEEKEKFCSYDIDCAKEESMCSDGVDPYHKCISGKCVNLTFIRDPCLEHICPKGNWIRKTDDTCFRYEKCAEKGCDDNSDITEDECVAIGTRSEGCLYTINRCKLKPESGSCEAYFKGYYFDSNEGICKEFIYCDGVALFDTLEECQKNCEKLFCEKDSDCIPEQCCHPTSCVNKKFAPNCEGIFCTMVCEGPIDCGAGKCSCVDERCIVERSKK
ncbi:MAG: DUF333 domain-containing protein [Candidatus Altiarchaeota archaeon]